MRYDGTVIAYHGCEARTADDLLKGEPFEPSENDHDWLGAGTYFWEFGADRAMRFAEEQAKRGKIRAPTIVGAVLQLGNCFDLMDTRFTRELPNAFRQLKTFPREDRATAPGEQGEDP